MKREIPVETPYARVLDPQRRQAGNEGAEVLIGVEHGRGSGREAQPRRTNGRRHEPRMKPILHVDEEALVRALDERRPPTPREDYFCGNDEEARRMVEQRCMA